jgi:hypothetical protein
MNLSTIFKLRSRDKIRVSLDLSHRNYDRLGILQQMVDSDTQTALIRDALKLYERVVFRVADSYEFREVAPNGKEEKVDFFGTLKRIAPLEAIRPEGAAPEAT